MNSTILDWAKRWGLPVEALQELYGILGVNKECLPTHESGESEAAVSARVRIEASQKGARLWRNNVGAVQTPEGGMIRYGLCNDSKKLNQNIKSSDLIGIRPVTVTPDMVGRVLGQFVAREVKRAGWTYSNTDREYAQLAFISLVQALGGDAAFCTDEGTL